MAPEETCAQVTGGVTITPAHPTLSPGTVLQFTASLDVQDPCVAVSTEWRWSSSAPSVLAVDSLTGVATGIAPGDAMLIAVPTFDPTVSGVDTVIVTPLASASDNRSVRPSPRGSASREGR